METDPSAARGLLRFNEYFDSPNLPPIVPSGWTPQFGTTATPDLLTAYVQAETETVRQLVAASESTPSFILAVLAKDEDNWVRCYVARNPNTPYGTLQDLVEDPSEGVRYWLASSHDDHADILVALATDREPWVRLAVSQQRATPKGSLIRLANDDDPNIRINVAMHPNTPPDCLAAMANDPSIAVREWVARNPSTPRTVLSSFRGDPVPTVRSSYFSNPSFDWEDLKRNLDSDDEFIALGLAQNPNLEPENFESLIRRHSQMTHQGSGLKALRQSIAANPNAPSELLDRIVREDNWSSTREAIARHPRAFQRTHDFLLAPESEEDHYEIRMVVISEGHPSKDALLRMVAIQDFTPWGRSSVSAAAFARLEAIALDEYHIGAYGEFGLEA